MAARLRDTLAGWLRWAADRLVPTAETVVEERSLPGAPEHWLSLVRDRAPHLLRPAKVLSVAAAASVRAAPAPPPAGETQVRWTGVAVAVSAAAPPPARRASIEDGEPRPAVHRASTEDAEPSRRAVRRASTEDTGPSRPAVRLRPAVPEPVRSPAPRRLPEPAEAPAARPTPASQEDLAPRARPVPEDDTAPRTKPAVRVEADTHPTRAVFTAPVEEAMPSSPHREKPAPPQTRREQPARRPADRPQKPQKPRKLQKPGTPGRGPVVLRWPDLPDSARDAWSDETPPDEVPPHHTDAPPRRHGTAATWSELPGARPARLPEVAEHVVRSGPWPRLGDETHRRWPELPDDSAQWEVTPRPGGDRIRRLDEEQRGLPWNA
ncbi:hypothetical protein [Dactylosporangium sp. NPDC006015]|uniref:hypothetical protein n=1 Tax=Dactylosporangium sp. NPDC006015 TaxID=3154576 RepID=UPI0033A17A29